MIKGKEEIKGNIDTSAWVVFCKDTDIWWLRFLKKGYRHCFVILNDGRNWITYDPMSNFTDIAVLETPLSFDLPRWFSVKGYKVVSCFINRKRKIAPLFLFTCVEGVKRVLGIHKFRIMTPYQLYKYLLERN